MRSDLTTKIELTTKNDADSGPVSNSDSVSNSNVDSFERAVDAERSKTTSRRRILKVGAVGWIAAALGGAAFARDADATPGHGFPYRLDGCSTFEEYRRRRKASGRPLDGVVVDAANPALVRDESRCANCGRCDEACMAQSISHWYDRDALKNGASTICVYCGQCATACKFNVLSERLQYPEVLAAISNDKSAPKRTKTFVATTAPALRVSLGEMFGLAPGADLEKKIVAALRRLGFDFVFDVAFGADLTTEEESRELWARLGDSNAAKPLFTSCCPAWVRFVETFYPEFIPNLSTTRSPIFAQGAAIKTKFARDAGLDPASIVSVAFVPCVGKKFEATRPEANAAGRFGNDPTIRDLDFALTTRELAAWLTRNNVDPTRLDDDEYDSSVGNNGAGKIFGATGGVAGSAARALWRTFEKTNLPPELLALKDVRGIQGLRETSATVGGKTIRIAVVCGLSAARTLLETLKTTGKLDYDFVEVMACPGGCVGGGGQPKRQGMLRPTDADRQARADGLFALDEKAANRTSGDNPEIQAIYRDFIGEPLGERAETLFHTSFQPEDVWKR